MRISFLVIVLLACAGCSNLEKKQTGGNTPVAVYFNYGDTGVQSAGVTMIPVNTPAGVFKVWTKRFGNNPSVKVLLLHGGPAGTHEYMECFESFFPKEGFEFYEYDQLGSYYSDQPTDSSLWTTDRFVEEVEQVRKAIGANKDNFYILGNSWGGILGMQYALKYQDNMKALIVANMMASCPEYGEYSEKVLSKQMKPEVLAEVRAIEAKGDFSNPRYMELLMPNFYKQHLCRLTVWPEAVDRSFKHMNSVIYTMMQGPSEFGIAGRLDQWNRKADLPKITVPVLTIGGRYDTMDPEYMKWMSTQVPKGEYLYCPNGSHMSMYDDQQTYMKGVIDWIQKTDH